MSFANKLGKSYEAVKDQAKLKKITVELGEVKFDLKVRIPLKNEMEELLEKIASPSEEKVDALFQKLSQGIRTAIDEGGEDFLKIVNSEKETFKELENDIESYTDSIQELNQTLQGKDEVINKLTNDLNYTNTVFQQIVKDLSFKQQSITLS